MSTPLKQRIFQAKQWLIENPDESLYVAAKIFKVNRSTLASAKRRGTLFSTNSKPHDSQNRILTAAQGQAVHAYIKSLLENSQLPTKEIIFNAICHVRKQANQPSPTINFEYLIISFFQDLPQIRCQTFTKSTIQSTFKKAGIYPVYKNTTFKLMNKYAKKPESKPPKPDLPKPSTPKSIQQVQYQIDKLKDKVIDILSSPSQRKFKSFIKGTHAILEEEEYVKFQLSITHERLKDIITKKPHNHKRLQKGEELTASWAIAVKEEKEHKEAKKETKKKHKKERLRKKALKELKRVLSLLELYKEYTPPLFPEPRKEVPSLEPPNTGLNTQFGPSEEVNILPQGRETIQGAIPVQVRTSFGVIRKEEEEEEEEEYISLNIGGDDDYESTDSESSDSINSMLASSESDISEEGEYFVL
ncbi:hypothetical protein B7463_g10947, partial [Scytalidium lignicola]